MKISKLFLEDFHQFKDFGLDLTYPEGHDKAGRPLEKVCIIGQSGTGKTNLLLFIKKALNFLGEISKLEQAPQGIYETHLLNVPSKFEIRFEGNPEVFSYLSFFSPRNFSIRPRIDHITGQQEKIFLGFDNQDIQANYDQRTGPPGDRGIRFQEHAWRFLRTYPFGYLYFPVDLANAQFSKQEEVTAEIKPASLFEGIDLNTHAAHKSWEKILDEVKKYDETYIEKSVALSKNEALRKGFDEWKNTAYNPLKVLAQELLDDVLNKFNLRVNQDTTFERKEDIGLIKIETLQGEKIPTDAWSTGTKHLIFSALPLFALKPEKKIILFDEPERSLYPDIQIKLIDILTKETLTTDCQFFFATHSPLVASSFEPWEIVELKFREDGSVYQELYFKNERHVNNYFIDPQLLRWDGILQRVFDLDTASNPKRGTFLNRLAELKKELEQKGLSKEDRAEKWEEFAKLAEKLNWDFEELDK